MRRHFNFFSKSFGVVFEETAKKKKKKSKYKTKKNYKNITFKKTTEKKVVRIVAPTTPLECSSNSLKLSLSLSPSLSLSLSLSQPLFLFLLLKQPLQPEVLQSFSMFVRVSVCLPQYKRHKSDHLKKCQARH